MLLNVRGRMNPARESGMPVLLPLASPLPPIPPPVAQDDLMKV